MFHTRPKPKMHETKSLGKKQRLLRCVQYQWPSKMCQAEFCDDAAFCLIFTFIKCACALRERVKALCRLAGKTEVSTLCLSLFPLSEGKPTRLFQRIIFIFISISLSRMHVLLLLEYSLLNINSNNER